MRVLDLVALSLFAPALPAVELLLGDVEALVEFPALAFDFELDDGIATREGSDGFDYGVGLAAGGVRAFPGAGSSIGPYLAGHLVAERLAMSDGGLTSYGLRGSAGLAWAVGDRVVLAAGAGLEGGAGRLDLPRSDSHAAFDGDGYHWGGQLELRGRYAVAGAWSLVGSGGYAFTRHAYADGGIDIDLERRGFFVGIGLSYRLAQIPAALE